MKLYLVHDPEAQEKFQIDGSWIVGDAVYEVIPERSWEDNMMSYLVLKDGKLYVEKAFDDPDAEDLVYWTLRKCTDEESMRFLSLIAEQR